MVTFVVVWSDAAVEVSRSVIGPLSTNVYLITCRRTGHVALVDPADDPDDLVDLARRLRVDEVIVTHGHADHVGALEALAVAGWTARLHQDDATLVATHTRHLADGERLEVGRLRLSAHHTPGHTPGSSCISVDGAPLLVVGDTLFPGGPGATHFPGGDFPTIVRSLDERVLRFPDETIVWPGHGAPTTIGAERPHLDEWIERGW